MVDLAGLNEPQQRAVMHGNGPLLIFAGAGSGKTRVLTHRVVRLIEEGTDPTRILLITFTNKAADEMKHRMRDLLGGHVRGLVSGTFHSIAVRILRSRAHLIERSSSFDIYATDEQETVVKQVLKDLDLPKEQYKYDEIVERIEGVKRLALRPRDFEPKDEDEQKFKDIWEQYEGWLRYGNALDFEDLILNAMELAEADDGVGDQLRQRFDHVLVDEFQDTNATQYRLVKALAENGNLVVVGDDDQSLYSWRGADRSIILGFKHAFAEATVVKLEQNYRSTSHIVAAGAAVVSKSAQREPKTMWTDAPPGARIAVVRCHEDATEGRFVAEQARDLVRAGASPREIAVLYRSKTLSRPVEDQLRLLGVPYTVIGGHTFYEREEVKDLLAYMRLVKTPDSDVDFLRIANKPVRGVGAGTLKKLRDIARRKSSSMWSAIAAAEWSDDIRYKEREQLGKFRVLMTDLMERAIGMRPQDLAHALVYDLGYKRHWEQEAAEAGTPAKQEKAAERAQNCDQVIESVAAYERRTIDRGEAPTLGGYLEEVALLSDRDKSDGDVEKMTMMTVHTAKGLEFDYVFIVGCESGLMPHSNAITLHEQDEERRVAYVAITRARKQLWITHCATRLKYNTVVDCSPSPYIADLPAECFVDLDEDEYNAKKSRAAIRPVVRVDPQLGRRS